MIPWWLVGATLLSAAPDPPGKAKSLPFPPPRIAVRSETLKCDTGTVIGAAPGRATLRVRTPAGAVAYRILPGAPVFDREGKAATVASLRAGERVRVYYLIDDGPWVVEIDLD